MRFHTFLWRAGIGAESAGGGYCGHRHLETKRAYHTPVGAVTLGFHAAPTARLLSASHPNRCEALSVELRVLLVTQCEAQLKIGGSEWEFADVVEVSWFELRHNKKAPPCERGL